MEEAVKIIIGKNYASSYRYNYVQTCTMNFKTKHVRALVYVKQLET